MFNMYFRTNISKNMKMAWRKLLRKVVRKHKCRMAYVSVPIRYVGQNVFIMIWEDPDEEGK